MKKGLKILAIMLTTFMSSTYVKADTIVDTTYGGSNPKSELWYLKNLNWTTWSDFTDNSENKYKNCNGREDCYNQAIDYFSTLNKQYYSMFVQIYPQENRIELIIIPFNLTNENKVYQNVYSSGNNIDRFNFSNNTWTEETEIYSIVLTGWSDPYRNNFYTFYDSNYNFINEGDYVFKGFYDNEGEENYNSMLQVHSEDTMPKIKDLIQYNSWSDYENEHLEGYTEVNLDNYEYVLLSLKNYNQTKAFSTNLQVNGQIGITPIYDYGQVEKKNVDDVEFDDRCNVNYENYTSYPFYILQSDLQNNAIYAVKECSSGSSFKFDNNIFDITYITTENKDDPVVTINGKEYHTIPFDSLTNTANLNEENDIIPGESSHIAGSNSFTGLIGGIISNTSTFISSIAAFMSLISKFFYSLPFEIRAVIITSFTTMCTLGVIKFLKA